MFKPPTYTVMGKKAIVEIPKSHRNEWKSKRNFQDLIESMGMYMPFEWAVRDYGIDGQVEITQAIKNSDSLRPASKYFLVQLKSTEKLKATKSGLSYSLPVVKIVQWHSANLPVMVVINDQSAFTFYGFWIDEMLISKLDRTKPNWTTQQNVAIGFSQTHLLDQSAGEKIKQHVIGWKLSSKKILQPGTYFNLKEKCRENLEAYSALNKSFGFDSVNGSVTVMQNQIDQAIYRIAITGPSRVGKSTLINALLKRSDASPTGFFQTTGVPIQFLPGKDEEITVTFKDSKSITTRFSRETIDSYASQQKNEDNQKGVSLVSIFLNNKQLEYGVSFFDIPGLDDPDDEIVHYTWNTLAKANAILYLIDASSAEHGGFIFRSEYKRQITELGQSLDKIFLVFNKVNALTGNKLELLRERVEKDLTKLNLFEHVSNKIYYISAEESLQVRTKKHAGLDSVKPLEDDIWSFLLKENKVGLVNLSLINREMLRACENFEAILNARLIDSESRQRLEKAITDVKGRTPELFHLYEAKRQEIKKGVSQSLENKKNKLLNELEGHLKAIPTDKNLPERKLLHSFLVQGAHNAIVEVNLEYSHQANLLKDTIDSWIETNLKTVREILSQNSQQRIVDMSEIDNFVNPPIDISTSFGVGIVAGIIAFILNPPAAIWAGLSGFFGNLLLSTSERRANRISKIMDEARKRYNTQFEKIDTAFHEGIDDNLRLIHNYSSEKISSFFNDLKGQINKLGSEISSEDEKHYRDAFLKLKDLKISINKATDEINGCYSAM